MNIRNLTALAIGTILATVGLNSAGAQTEQVVTTFQSRDVPQRILDNSSATMTVPINEPGSASVVEVSFDITHSFPTDVRVRIISPDGRSVFFARGILSASRVRIPEFAGLLVAGTWTVEAIDDTDIDGGTLNSFSVTLTRPGINGIAYATLIQNNLDQASSSYANFVAVGDSNLALASLFYYYAFATFYQGELDQNIALRDFSYFFFLAYYHLYYQYSLGNAELAVENFYLNLAYAYYQFYFLSGYPSEASRQYQAYINQIP